MISMISLPLRKWYLLGILLVAFLILSACRTESADSSELALVWEAWDVVKSSYVDGQSLDSKQAAGGMITNMLDAHEKPTYPFLTELEDVRSRRPRDVPAELTDVWKAWTLFQEKWPEVSSGDLSNAAISGMLGSLGSTSTAHLNNEDYRRVQQRLEGSYTGIGAFVAMVEDQFVMSPMEESPALKAGVEVGDVVLEVDGEPVGGKTVDEVINQVRGPVGTKVTMLLERAGEEEPIELSIIRGDISVSTVDRQLLPGAIGHIYISDFRDNTPDEVLDALEQLQQVDMLALILDLRDNPGGSIESAHKVVSQFLPEGLFMYEIDKDGVRADRLVEEGGLATKELPMVVLVNQLTASAAEAVAGAIQDAERAEIFGTSTFGKGSASKFEQLSDGSAIYLPVSHWYTPQGRLIEGSGITPDTEVDFTPEDRLSQVDVQLVEAYDYLNSLLPLFR